MSAIPLNQGAFTLSEGFHDKREVDEAEEEAVEPVKPGEEVPEGFHAAEHPFHCIPCPVPLAVRGPGRNAVAGGICTGRSRVVPNACDCTRRWCITLTPLGTV